MLTKESLLSVKEKNYVIEKLCRKYNLPMVSIEGILDDIGDLLCENKDNVISEQVPICSGILTIDNIVNIKPGITMIYGPDSSGKSAISKSIARISHKKGLNVLYVDTETKLTPEDNTYLNGVFYTNQTEAQAIHRILNYRLIDVMVVDSITAMLPQSQNYLIHHARKTVPYIIITSQLRYDMENNIMVPACWDTIKSTANTHIKLTDPVNIEKGHYDFMRCGFYITKHSDNFKVGEGSSFVIKRNWIRNSYTAFDLLDNCGKINRYGDTPTYQGKVIDFDDEHSEITQSMIIEAMKILGIRNSPETYFEVNV